MYEKDWKNADMPHDALRASHLSKAFKSAAELCL